MSSCFSTFTSYSVIIISIINYYARVDLLYAHTHTHVGYKTLTLPMVSRNSTGVQVAALCQKMQQGKEDDYEIKGVVLMIWNVFKF